MASRTSYAAQQHQQEQTSPGDVDGEATLTSDVSSKCQWDLHQKLNTTYLLARDLGYLDHTAADTLISKSQEVKRMLTSFLKKLTADR